jgi:hypothetical protein
MMREKGRKGERQKGRKAERQKGDGHRPFLPFSLSAFLPLDIFSLSNNITEEE